MSKEFVEHYAAHVATMQYRWEEAIEAENLQAILVHSGTPLISFQDDYEYAFRPNPNFLAWLPLTHHHDSALLIRPGEKPQLFYYQPDDYWYLPPSDPEPWWADHFDIQVVAETDDWRTGLFACLDGLSFDLRDVAAIGDAPSLAGTFEADRINPPSLVNRLQVERTRKTAYEIACMMEASRLAAHAHVEAERAFREGESEYRIHQRYLGACAHSDAGLPYNNIVALNSHGAVLHYQAREQTVPPRVLSFLIDAGCTVNGYASDITRSYARDAGDFADLVEISSIDPFLFVQDHTAHGFLFNVMKNSAQRLFNGFIGIGIELSRHSFFDFGGCVDPLQLTGDAHGIGQAGSGRCGNLVGQVLIDFFRFNVCIVQCKLHTSFNGSHIRIGDIGRIRNGCKSDDFAKNIRFASPGCIQRFQ